MFKTIKYVDNGMFIRNMDMLVEEDFRNHIDYSRKGRMPGWLVNSREKAHRVFMSEVESALKRGGFGLALHVAGHLTDLDKYVEFGTWYESLKSADMKSKAETRDLIAAHVMSYGSRKAVDALANFYGVDSFPFLFDGYLKAADAFEANLAKKPELGINSRYFRSYWEALFYDGVEGVLPKWNAANPIKTPF